MEKILENAINALFKNIREIPRMCYAISALVFLGELNYILQFHYKGDNAFYNFLLIFINIIFTGFLYGGIEDIKKLLLAIFEKIDNRKKIINLIKTVSYEEKQFFKYFVETNSSTITVTIDELDIIEAINLKYDCIETTENAINNTYAVISPNMLKLLKDHLK